jgi:hypothetical protein
MIAKISNISSFNAALRYIVNKKESLDFEGETIKRLASSRVGGRMLTDTVGGMTKEFALIPNNLTHPGKHLSISLPIGEKLDNDTWLKVAKDVMELSGYGKNQWICYRHSDQKHDHVHILMNRKDFAGKTISDSLEKREFMKIMRQMEEKYDLTRFVKENNKVKETTLEARLGKKGITTDKKEVNSRIKKAISKSNNWIDFPLKLEQEGVKWNPRTNDLGVETGARYDYNGKTYAGSKVGYSLQNIEAIFFEKKQEKEHQLKEIKEKKKINMSEYALLIVERQIQIGHLSSFLEKKGYTEQEEKAVDILFKAFSKLNILNEIPEDLREPILKTFQDYELRRQVYKKKPEVIKEINNPIPAEPINVSQLDQVYSELRTLFKGKWDNMNVTEILRKTDKEIVAKIDPNMFVGLERSRVIKSKEKVLKGGMNM